MADSEDDEQNTHRRSLFVKEDGRPAKFYLHPSIHREGQRQKLRADIKAYGGRVASTDDRVDTVLISKAYDDIELLRTRYGVDDDKDKRAIHVERLSFVQHCIQEKQFKHRLPIPKGMGGQLGYKHATKFTESDDENLCAYIARQLPRKEAGGRLGNRLYKRLVDLGERFPEHFSWARRHTFNAWRERYKKKRDIFDPIIEEIAKRDGTYDNQLWPEDRRMSRRRLRRRIEDETSEGEEFGEEEEDQVHEDLEEEEEEEELSEDGGGLDDDHGQQIEAPEDGDLEEQPVQDAELDLTEIKKRKRVQAAASPGQVAKKRRYDQNMSPVRPKGKEIEHESDQDDEMANTSLFSIDGDEDMPPEDFDNEPGPSNILRSPDRTMADSKSNQISFTQETLVNTQSRMEFEPVSHSTSANRRHSGNASRSQLVSFTEQKQERQPLLDLPSLPPQSSPNPRPPAQPRPPITAGTSRGGRDVPPNPTETIQPARRGAKPLSKQKAPFTVQPDDAPYRNTRARSRSVEPVAMPPPKYKPARSRKQNPEAAKMEDSKRAWTDPDRIPITETIEEEMDVEQILITKDANMGTAVRPRNPSLETDDAQTRQNLYPPSAISGRPSARRTFLSNKTKPSDVLRKFSESLSSSRRYSQPSLQRPPTQNVLALDENRRTFKLQEPRTPTNVPRTRQESTSSVESFPLKGTRASAKKKERQEQEKHTPYKPPEGTRAAQVATLNHDLKRNTR